MLYLLYAGTFFYNVLFYIRMLQDVQAADLLLYNTGYMVLCAAGMLAYGLGHERIKAGRRGRLLGGAAAVSVLAGGLWWLGLAPLVLAVLLFALPFGYVTGHIAWLVTRMIPGERQGRFIGTSLALCNLILYLVLYLPPLYQLAALGAAGLLSAILLGRSGQDAHCRTEADHSEELAGVLQANLPLAVLTAVALGLLVGLDDSIFFPRFADYETTFAPSRIFTAAGFFLAGLAADRFPWYLPLIAIAAKAVPLFVRAGNDVFVLQVLSYSDAFFTGVLIILVVRMFFLLAPLTKCPRVWAGMGRGIEMPTSALGSAFGVIYLEGQSLPLIVACHTALLLLCAMLFYRGLMIYASRESAYISAQNLNFRLVDDINYLTKKHLAMADIAKLPLCEAAPAADDWQQQYNFTERETEVLALVMKEKTIAEIADRLCVTERTIKFHIGNLLKKTGCKNQKELRETCTKNH